MNKVYLVGGAGYIGSLLQKVLNSQGWQPEVIDCGIFGNVPPAAKQDVLDMEPPGDGAPVIWLATVHREPDFGKMPEEDCRKWAGKMAAIMFEKIEPWIRAGHPLVYCSSMQVAELMGGSAYAYAKRMFEAQWVGTAGVQIIRFGTVWGGYDQDLVRIETAINSSLLGKKLTENYRAYTTHISRAVEALSYAICRDGTGTVENVLDDDEPRTGPQINAIVKTAPKERSLWEHLYMSEWVKAEKLREAGVKRTHFTALLAEHYHLPWPEEISKEYDSKGPIV